MAKNTKMTLTGKVSWAKVFEDNRDMTAWNEVTRTFDLPCPNKGTYSIEVELDSAQYRELKSTGSLAAKTSKVDDVSGLDRVRFKRQHEKFSNKGDLMEWASGPPKVVKADGTPWDFEKDGDIGNGSTCEVAIEVYKTAYSPGTRLEGVRVLNHVPFKDSNSSLFNFDEKGEEEEEAVPF